MSDKIICITNEAGSWVKLEDYARLKDEVERLEAEAKRLNVEVDILRASSFVTAVSVEQYERLRKAGDELAEAAGLSGCSECFGLYDRLEDAITAWNAAKEGKPIGCHVNHNKVAQYLPKPPFAKEGKPSA